MNRLCRLFLLVILLFSVRVEAQELRQPEETQAERAELVLPEGWVSQVGLYARIHGPPDQALKLDQLLDLSLIHI